MTISYSLDAVDQMPVGIVTTDLDGRIISSNNFVVNTILRVNAEDLLGRHVTELFAAGARLFYKLQLAQVLHLNGSFSEAALQIISSDGAVQDVLVNARKHGEAITFALFPAEARRLREREYVTAREAAETKNRLLAQIERMASIGAWTLEADQETLTWSDEIFRIYELPMNHTPSLATALSCFAEADVAEILRLLKQAFETGILIDYTSDFFTFAGNRRRVRFIAELEAFHAAPARLVGVLQDITESAKAERELEALAHFDPLTGLANRAQFQKHLDISVALAAGGSEIALLLLDLDGFKEVNDTLGHDAGDKLLEVVGSRIRSVAAELFCARLGGDEFVVILADSVDYSPAALATKISQELAKPTSIRNLNRAITASIGIVTFTGEGQDPGNLYKRADLALYQAKKQGRNRYVIFEPQFETDLEAKHAQIKMVQEAAKAGELVPYFQPIVTAFPDQPINLEALVRIAGADGKILSPAQFGLALSDHSCCELIHQAVLHEVLRVLSRWKEMNLPVHKVSFNLAEGILRAPDFPQSFLNQVSAYGIPPQALIVEVQETVFLGRDSEVIKARLEALQRAGCLIALDDFGTGFASLSHLVEFPVDYIKIDRSFVSAVDVRPDKQAIVQAIIGLGKNLHLTVVAEGVETNEQFLFLRESGCGYFQGFLFGKAMSSQAVEDQLQKRSSEFINRRQC